MCGGRDATPGRPPLAAGAAGGAEEKEAAPQVEILVEGLVGVGGLRGVA
eukprot:CAMPEP_0181229758 /NCGR_PEP_ID=MMETSP1096-20121128/34083_1 /TAXON_ID=156174 ORGANISM="Chrysochromulina ericina, Strain CCMP281" /NCGR_SAMPLE_ID=MMETSP1096 /ASSEMBLY_ACC=CAM_ASM_000453 /LENGTH=48 /DNA_ID= /DNA_START= /DNA_END= /DNA_ORIENTATION=